jgi:hypothetical protein
MQNIGDKFAPAFKRHLGRGKFTAAKSRQVGRHHMMPMLDQLGHHKLPAPAAVHRAMYQYKICHCLNLYLERAILK